MTREQLIDQAVRKALRPGQYGGVGLNWPKGKRQAEWGLTRVRNTWRQQQLIRVLEWWREFRSGKHQQVLDRPIRTYHRGFPGFDP